MLSWYIVMFESQFGVCLFECVVDGVVLIDIGVVLIVYVKDMVDLVLKLSMFIDG